MTDANEWIGREERQTDRLDVPLAHRWLATLNLTPREDGSMPQGIHWCLCVPETPTARLGPDGHPASDGSPGSFQRPVPAARRMWAGSDLPFHAPIPVSAWIERLSRTETIEDKQGGSGKLTFVTVSHEPRADNVLAVTERQTLVYRDAPPPGAPPAPPPLGDTRFNEGEWEAVERMMPTMPLLFRYSALTFNTHRIHYDADYVRDVENYRGPVVHGPLTATLLLRLAARKCGENRLARFAFRGTSPAIVDEELVLALRGPRDALELGAFAADGRQVMKAEAACQG